MDDEIKDAIRSYLKARRELFAVAEKYPEELRGNDNVIGQIGEYLAIQFLREEKGRTPIKTRNLSQKGFDLEDGPVQISVKILTSENQRGRGMRLTDPWHEFLLIHLSMSDLSGRVGFITREKFDEARIANPRRSQFPKASISMLGQGGLFSKFGEIKEVARFL